MPPEVFKDVQNILKILGTSLKKPSCDFEPLKIKVEPQKIFPFLRSKIIF